MEIMKKLLVSIGIVSFVVVGVNSQEIQLSEKYIMINGFVQDYKGNKSIKDIKKFTDSQCFKNANEYLYNPSLQKDFLVREGNANLPREQVESTHKVANYPEALKSFTQCVKRTQNPLAAWQGMIIIKNFLGINYNQNIDAYRLFSKTLYKNMNCTGYLNYGDIHAKGINTKPDLKKAKRIYMEGKEMCKNGWISTVLTMKLNNIENLR